jgi:hypothetical protein
MFEGRDPRMELLGARTTGSASQGPHRRKPA